MSLTKKSTKDLVSEFAQGKTDTGSPEVQCALITKQIDNLTEHLKIHRGDFSSKRGLLILVSKRRKLLNYLKDQDPKRYEALIKKLEIRK
jgi:small subunit ribosomal protein S15